MKRRILFVSSTELQNAGIPNVVMTLVRQSHEYYTFDLAQFSDKQGHFDKEFQQYGGEIHRLSLTDCDVHKMQYPLRGAQIKKALQRILKSQNYDAIHCHCGVEAGICLQVAKQMKIPCRISHAHGTYRNAGINIFRRTYLDYCRKQIQKYATEKLACSQLAGETLFLDAQFQNVLNPVDIAYYAKVEKRPHEEIHLLQIGYMNENKNQLFSLRILRMLRNRGVNAYLTIIGYIVDEEYYARLKEYIEAQKLGHCVNFLPSNADKCQVLSTMDYTLLPSRSEGLPLVALESQAAGVLCLMSEHVPEDTNLGGALRLPYNDVEAWAEEILKEHNVDWSAVQTRLQPLSPNEFARKIGEIYES